MQFSQNFIKIPQELLRVDSKNLKNFLKYFNAIFLVSFFKIYQKITKNKNYFVKFFWYFLKIPSNFFMVLLDFLLKFSEITPQISRNIFPKIYLQFLRIFPKMTQSFYENVWKIYSKNCFLFLWNFFLIFLKIFKYFFIFFFQVLPRFL